MGFMEPQITDKERRAASRNQLRYGIRSPGTIGAYPARRDRGMYGIAPRLPRRESGVLRPRAGGLRRAIVCAGYLDCTEWAVFDTEEETRAYLEETYGEEDRGDRPLPIRSMDRPVQRRGTPPAVVSAPGGLAPSAPCVFALRQGAASPRGGNTCCTGLLNSVRIESSARRYLATRCNRRR